MTDLYGNIPISDEPNQPAPSPKPSPPRPTPQRPAEKTSLLKRWYIYTPLILLLLAAGYYIASSALVPIFIEKKFPQIVHNNTGLNLSIASSRFNPLEFSVYADGIDIESVRENEPTEILTIGDLYIDLDFISLLRHGLVSESLLISDAVFTLVRYSDTSYNISQFFGTDLGDEAVSDVMNFAELPFLYSLNNISISNSSILFKDMRSEKQHRVENLNINLPTLSNFSYDVGHYIQPHFSAVINGSPVELTGDTELPTTEGEETPTKMSFTLQDIDLPLYAGYLPIPLPVDIEKGRVSGSISLSFLSQSSDGRQLNFGYQLQVEDGIFHSHDRALALNMPLLNIEGRLDPLKNDITIDSLLLRDPFLRISRNFSTTTVGSLFPGDDTSKQETAIPLQPLSLRVDLLIADNGKIEIETERDTLVFAPVQYSMRNYSYGRESSGGDPSEESSFRLSGESTNDFSLFSWQGHFEEGAPVGEVEINNLPFSLVLERILPNAGSQAEGSTDIRGRLSLRRGEAVPIVYGLEKGTIRLSKITLAENQRPWLRSSAGRLSPVSIDGDRIDLGNLFLEDAHISLQGHTLPGAIDTLLNEGGSTLQGIDFKGTLTMQEDGSGGLPLELEKVHLQATDLNTPVSRKDNFALSADVNGDGSIKAKGRLRISPVAGNFDLGFSDVAAASLFTAEETSPVVFSEQLLLSGSGTFDIESQRFKGSLETSGGSATHQETGSTYSFDKAALASLSTALDLRDCSVDRIMLKGMSFSTKSLRLTADGASMSSFDRKGDDLQADELVLADAKISLLSGFSLGSLPFMTAGKGSITLDKVLLDGKVDLISTDDERRELIPAFSAEVAPLSNTLPKKENLSAEIRLTEGGQVKVDGTLALAPFQSKLSLNLKRVPSEYFAPLAPEDLKFSLETLINGEVAYYYPQKMLTGDLQLVGGRLYTSDGTDLAGWDTAILSDFKYTMSPLHLGITKLTLDTPRFFYSNTGDHPLLVIRRALQSSLPQEDVGSGSISFSRLDVVRIDIQDGLVEYLDERMTPAWQTDISSFSGFIDNYHLSESSEPIRYGVSGTIEGGGLAAHGSITVAGDDGVAAKSVVELKRMPLNILKEQLLQSFALQVDQAHADAYCTLGGESDVDRARLTISSLMPADPASPLAMTIALLSDTPDSFSETVALKDEDKPVIDQIINHFQKLVVKTGVSPYLLLPEKYATLRQDNALVFEPGESALSSTARATLDAFALLIEDYPRLRLIFHSIVDPSDDGSALQTRLENEEQKRVQQENQKLLQQWTEQSRKQSSPSTPEGAIVEKEIVDEELQAFAPVSATPVVITETMLKELGRERLKNASAYLLDKHAVPKENIALDDEPRISGQAPEIMVDLHNIGAEKQTESDGNTALSPHPPFRQLLQQDTVAAVGDETLSSTPN